MTSRGRYAIRYVYDGMGAGFLGALPKMGTSQQIVILQSCTFSYNEQPAAPAEHCYKKNFKDK
ncbi:MAG TPA: hypothetical protein DCL60_13910 [Armatimonadetes bacterium]|nr:hypothetical protein [Armatimonadota bacterium]